jgi:RNA polymerase sigma factor (sigma-70 family)
MEFKPNFTEREKNQFAKQYEPLVRKLVKQTVDKGFPEWDQIESAAWEGFAHAMKNYDPQRSKLSFQQYAGWSIRNYILLSIDNELRTVKVDWYNRKKAEERGDQIYQRISFDAGNSNDQDDNSQSNSKFKFDGMHTRAKFDDGDVYEYMYTRLESNFSKENCDIFYRSFGLKGYNDIQKGKDIAKTVGVSEGAVSQKVKKIVTWMRNDAEMCEMLSNLME